MICQIGHRGIKGGAEVGAERDIESITEPLAVLSATRQCLIVLPLIFSQE